jgi:hypothetical protein
MNTGKRGRPKTTWDPYGDELQRRLEAGEALATVTAEARALAEWGRKNTLRLDGFPNDGPNIAKRIKLRHGGVDGYVQVRSHWRNKLGLD